jgi:hypothetical protein
MPNIFSIHHSSSNDFIVLLVCNVITLSAATRPCLLAPQTLVPTYASCSAPCACLVCSPNNFPFTINDLFTFSPLHQFPSQLLTSMYSHLFNLRYSLQCIKGHVFRFNNSVEFPLPFLLLFVQCEQLDILGSVLTLKTPMHIKYLHALYYLKTDTRLPLQTC